MTQKKIRNAVLPQEPESVIECILHKVDCIATSALGLKRNVQDEAAQCIQNIETLSAELRQGVENLEKVNSHEQLDESYWADKRHALRSVLNSIQGYAEFLLEESDGSDKHAQRLQTMIGCARTILPLVNSIHSLGDLRATEQESFVRNYNRPPTFERNVQGLKVLVASLKEGADRRYKLAFPQHDFTSVADYNAAGPSYAFDLLLFDIEAGDALEQNLLNAFSEDTTWSTIKKVIVCDCDYQPAYDVVAEHVDDCVFNAHDNPFAFKKVGVWLDLVCTTKSNLGCLRRLRGAQEVLTGAVENIDSGFVLCDPYDRIVLCNTKFKRFYPYTRDMNIGKSTYEQFVQFHMAENFYDYGELSAAQWFREHMSQRDSLQESIQKLSDGRWVKFSHNRTSDGGMVSIHADVTDQKNDTDRLTYQAHHDALTGLANRGLLDKRIPQVFENSRDKGMSCGVMYFDLDGFKAVNDEFGHDFGDDLLVEIAHRLRGCVRSKDIVARVGGDEFVVVATDLKNEKEASLLAKRMTKEIGTLFVKDGHKARFGVSMGISIFPSDGQDYESLIKLADQAMYYSKKTGKGAISLYRNIESVHFLQDGKKS